MVFKNFPNFFRGLSSKFRKEFHREFTEKARIQSRNFIISKFRLEFKPPNYKILKTTTNESSSSPSSSLLNNFDSSSTHKKSSRSYKSFHSFKLSKPFKSSKATSSPPIQSSVIFSDPRIKTEHCPGCGAKFQTRDRTKPGYLILRKLESKKKAVTDPNELGADDMQKILKSMPDDILKQLYPMGVVPSLDKNEDSEEMDSGVGEGKEKEKEKKEADKEDKKKERIFCQRCYNLTHYNKVVTEEWQESVTSDRSFLSYLRRKEDAIIITVVDIFDFPGTLLTNLDELIGTKNPNILVANKVDLLPKDASGTRIKTWLRTISEKSRFSNIHDVFLISAKKDWGIRELAEAIAAIRSGFDDIYLIGCANVGKSELINSFLRSTVVEGWRHKVTSSPIPGTTIGMIGLPLTIFGTTFGYNPKGFHFPQESKYLYDTPGIVNQKQLIHLLTEEELKMVIPQKMVKPLTYYIFPGMRLQYITLIRIYTLYIITNNIFHDTIYN